VAAQQFFRCTLHSRGNAGIMTVVVAQHFFASRCAVVLLAAAAVCCPSASAEIETPSDAYVAENETRVDARTYAGWRAIRQFDCARCHGARYQGSIGPSLIEAARANSRAEFLRRLLEGNRDRGMPPYRDVPGVADHAEGIYGYFKGRADGKITTGALQVLQ
jgi:mono/diheme cytochrome c family protein